MNVPVNAAEQLAQRVLAVEAHGSEASPDAVLHAIGKLRHYLTRFVGAAGFQTLLARALSLAKSQVAWLESVQVEPDASLTGLHEAARTRDADDARKAETVLLAQLLALLVIFIGETVTLHMVRDVWSDARLDDLNFNGKESI